MRWALAQHDPEHWLHFNIEADRLIKWNDGDFKQHLDRYKYADRYPVSRRRIIGNRLKCF
jgi:hypothetical protein